MSLLLGNVCLQSKDRQHIKPWLLKYDFICVEAERLMEEKLVIIGAGGHGKVVCDAALEAGFEVLGFYDDDPSKVGTKINGVPVLGSINDLFILDNKEKVSVTVAIGDNIVRARIYYKVLARGFKLATIVHPRSYTSKYSRIGWGTVVCAGAIVQPGAIIGDDVIINTGSTVDHDCLLFHHTCVNPQATLTGEVKVGYLATIHSNATVAPRKCIGDNAVVGAASLVLNDVPPDTVYVGVPARFLKINNKRPERSLVCKLFNSKMHSTVFEKKYEGNVRNEKDEDTPL